MWINDGTVLSNDGFFEETKVREGYIVAEGVEATLSFLRADNNSIGRDIFGEVFHIFKVNPCNPLKVRTNSLSGKLHIWPVASKYKKMMPAQMVKDKNCWNAVEFCLIPGEDKSLDYTLPELKKFVFPDSFRTDEGKTYPVSLIYILSGENVGFLGNYSSIKYSFVPPAQVGIHLYDWMVKKREVTSHERTFKQKGEGSIYIGRDDELAREKFFSEIVPQLEKRFEEKIIFSNRD